VNQLSVLASATTTGGTTTGGTTTSGTTTGGTTTGGTTTGGTTTGGTTTGGTTTGGTTTGGTTTGGTTGIPSTGVAWNCDFEGGYCGFTEQNAIGDTQGGRTSFVSTARNASQAIRLHTEQGDVNVHGSGTCERNDLSLGP